MSSINLFTGRAAGTVNIVTSGASSRVSLSLPAGAGGMQVRVKNIDTTNVVFIEFGDSTVAAAVATGLPIGPGETCGFTIPAGATHVAAIAGGGTPTIYFTPGQGI